MLKISNPIKYFENNMIFSDDNSCWAVYKLNGYNYDFSGDDGKIDILKRLTRIVANFERAKIFIIPTREDISAHYRKLRKEQKKSNPVYTAAQGFLRATEDYLNQNSDSYGNGYTTFVAVKIKTGNNPFENLSKEALKSFFREPMNTITDFLSKQQQDIPLYIYEQYQREEGKLFDGLLSRMAVERITSGETQWLLKRGMYRGVNKTIPINKTTKIIERDDGSTKKIYSSDWTPKTMRTKRYIRPQSNDITNMFSGVISTAKRTVCVEHDDGEVSYQTFLSLTHIPDSVEFPGSEWIYLLQQFPFETEVCIDIENTEFADAKRKIDSLQLRLNSELDEASDSYASIPTELLDGQDQGEQLAAEIKESKLPLSKVSVTVCLASDNQKKLDEMAAYIKNTYSDMNYIFERSLADQLALFMGTMPGTENYVNAYHMNMSPLTLAGGVFGVNNKLGDDEGYYIGTSGTKRKLVKLYLGLANLLNKSSGATFYGDLGYGKSFNANLLLYLHVLFGASGLVFDPKSERTHWRELPLIGHMVKIITIDSSDDYKGTLDAFNLYRNDIDKACSVALSVVSDLLEISMSSKEFTVLSEAINETRKCSVPSMKEMVKILRDWPDTDSYRDEANNLARRIEALQKIGLTKLLFGDGSERAISFNDGLNVVQIHNLQIPSPTTPKHEYTMEESVSAVIMGLLGDFSKQFAMQIKDKLKVVLFDESWFMCKTSSGLKAIEFLCRTGRSLFTSVLLNGHSVLDLPSETAENTITYKFCFHTSSREEAKRMLDYMKMDITDENINILTGTPEDGGLVNGECLFQDFFGRVGRLKFDAVFSDLIQAFKTTPTDSSKNEVLDEVESVTAKDMNRRLSADNQSDNITSIEDIMPKDQEAETPPHDLDDIVIVSADIVAQYHQMVKKYEQDT